jgi:hypothetical protein
VSSQLDQGNLVTMWLELTPTCPSPTAGFRLSKSQKIGCAAATNSRSYAGSRESILNQCPER